MSEPIPQHYALRLQFAVIAGDEPATSYFEIRSKRTGGGMWQDWIGVRELDRAARSAINRGQLGDTYIGAAPRAQRKGSAGAIERVWCLWADLDGSQALERLWDFRPLPSIVIQTGSEDRAHAYWPVRPSIPPEWAKRSNRRLALALGADRAATDAARILRPAGTRNHKHDPPRPVACTRLELDVFALRDVVGGLVDDPCYLPDGCRPRRCGAGDDKRIDRVARTVRDAPIGNRNNALFWAACRVAEHGLGGEAIETLRDAALANGLAEREIDQTLRSALERTAA